MRQASIEVIDTVNGYQVLHSAAAVQLAVDPGVVAVTCNGVAVAAYTGPVDR